MLVSLFRYGRLVVLFRKRIEYNREEHLQIEISNSDYYPMKKVVCYFLSRPPFTFERHMTNKKKLGKKNNQLNTYKVV